MTIEEKYLKIKEIITAYRLADWASADPEDTIDEIIEVIENDD